MHVHVSLCILFRGFVKAFTLHFVKVRIGELSSSSSDRADSTPSEHVPWRLVTPQGRESCRWQCTDGRWVSLTLGHDEEIGRVVICDSDGRRELMDSYEGALALARHWRR